jgi:hypothetical protein
MELQVAVSLRRGRNHPGVPGSLGASPFSLIQNWLSNNRLWNRWEVGVPEVCAQRPVLNKLKLTGTSASSPSDAKFPLITRSCNSRTPTPSSAKQEGQVSPVGHMLRRRTSCEGQVISWNPLGIKDWQKKILHFRDAASVARRGGYLATWEIGFVGQKLEGATEPA